jgi:hypothetical protein
LAAIPTVLVGPREIESTLRAARGKPDGLTAVNDRFPSGAKSLLPPSIHHGHSPNETYWSFGGNRVHSDRHRTKPARVTADRGHQGI